jgi:thiamine pyrophosphokinase
MRGVLVANGPVSDVPAARLRAAVAAAEFVVGIDGGTRTLLQLGLVPTHVTGDFDSLGEEERAMLTAQGVAVHPTPDQDFTDLDKALAFSFHTLDADSVAVFGATGGRLDHTYSVLSTLVKYGRDHHLYLVDGFGETFALDQGGTLVLDEPDLVGRKLSLMALGPVDGITTTGLRWPLSSESLAPGIRDGTLNEIVAETVTITHGSGDLLVMLHHAGDE